MGAAKGQFETGIGLPLITPYALLKRHYRLDVTGRSSNDRGCFCEPGTVIRSNLLIMPDG